MKKLWTYRIFFELGQHRRSNVRHETIMDHIPTPNNSCVSMYWAQMRPTPKMSAGGGLRARMPKWPLYEREGRALRPFCVMSKVCIGEARMSEFCSFIAFSLPCLGRAQYICKQNVTQPSLLIADSNDRRLQRLKTGVI